MPQDLNGFGVQASPVSGAGPGERWMLPDAVFKTLIDAKYIHGVISVTAPTDKTMLWREPAPDPKVANGTDKRWNGTAWVVDTGKRDDKWSIIGASHGTVHVGDKILNAEIITLPDLTGACPPFHGQTMRFAAGSGLSWDQWQVDGGRFQTENGAAGSTQFGANVIAGSGILVVQYNASNNRWYFYQ